MSPPAPRPFDVCGELPPPGVTVLEASAGTGKTFTIAALVARYVAAGVPASEILAVTFTRMATGELRERVRERLLSAHDHLARLLDHDVPVPVDDEVAELLASGSTQEVAERRRLLAEALACFDEATITTTHGFCQLVLASLGVAGGASPGDALIEDTSELVDQVVDDLYLDRALRHGAPAFSRRTALDLARQALRNPDTPLEPPPDDSVPGRLRRFADRARREFERRLREAELLTYDDLLLRLREVLVDPSRGQAACDRLAARYRVVLVDEFQDTDPVQWDVVSTAFGDGRTVLVLIGDPKQAIYAFRGADVYAYLAASAVAERRFTLGDNYRSDEDLLHALDALFEPMLLGHPEIPYRAVRAAPAHRRPGLLGAPSTAAVRARLLADDAPGVTRTKTGLLQKSSAVEAVADDLAEDVVALLSCGAELVEWDLDGAERRRRPVSASKVAVLVRTNRQASVVHEALRAAGVPSVIASSQSVFSTEAADHWLRLLEAIEQPASRPRCAAAALGPFVGMTAAELAAAGEAELETLQLRLRRHGEVLRRRGVAALFRAALDDGDMPARLLGRLDGERLMTDLAQVAELASAEAAASQLGTARLRAWLERRIAEAGEEESDERTRRLDSDAEAVQILTVHRSKGLEFPVVYCPYLFDPVEQSGEGRPVVYHDPAAGFTRTLDVGLGGSQPTPQYLDHARAEHQEARGEDLRLLYVALTRAKHQVVFWWARISKCQRSPLGRLLFSREPDGNVSVDGRPSAPKHAEVIGRLGELAAGAPGKLVVEPAGGRRHRLLGSPAGEPSELDAASFGRRIDLAWRRSSYSAITSFVHEELVASEPEAHGTVDEPSAAEPGAPLGPFDEGDGASEGRLAAACLLDAMAAGPEAGTAVHRIFELADFAATDLEAELAAVLDSELARRGTDLGEPAIVVAGLAAAIRTPLGGLVTGRRLCDLSRHHRLDELAFELPLAGGDRPSGSVGVADLAALLARYERPGDPLEGYAARLTDPALARELRGYLTGIIDLVLRQPGERRGADRYLVVDYKTNRLAAAGEPLRAWHYRPEALGAEMQRFHYPLQALLYVVALHRYLRWRLSGYDPERHLGGVLYLFLRGMTGADTPTVDGHPCGVFSWRPEPALVIELSDLLDRGVAARGVAARGVS